MRKNMYFLCTLLFCLLIFVFSGFKQAKSQPTSGTIAFDNGWKFIKDNPSGAENPAFDDSKWRSIDVPHDWSIEDLPGQNGVDIIGPFDKSSVDKMSSGYLVGGIGWYRKSFTINKGDKDKIAFLQFDGVYMNADVWVNGKHLGFHPNGYTPFYYDITSCLNPAGQPNVVAVRVRNEGLNSRWYSGSGINRHVWLTTVDPVHVDISGGLYVTTPSVSETSAEVKIVTTVLNTGSKSENIIVQTKLFDPTGRLVGSNNSALVVTGNAKREAVQNVKLDKPSLWSVEKPSLYLAKVIVIKDKISVGSRDASFGIRSIKIDAQNGLLLNGKAFDMIGGCYHHDNGPLGAASIDRAEERKIEILKKAGFNAIRTSHNPPSPALLDACDRLGMVVIDEIFDMWENS